MYDILIIGGGPAGLTAAIYACRAGLSVLVLEREMTGGKANFAYELENYPAEDGVSGTVLAIKMREQAEKYGAKFLSDEAVSVDCANKSVTTAYNGRISAKNLIIAAGTENRRLNVPKETELTGKGVSYCAVCDGGFFKRKTVAVIGGGNTAFKDALYLSRFAEKVYIVHRREGFRAEKMLVERAKAEQKIEFVLNAVVTELIGESRVEGVRLRYSTGDVGELKTDGVFVAVGASPNTALVVGQVKTDELGYIITDEEMRTDIGGVFAAGDIRKKSLRQIITACSDGAIAAEGCAE